MIKARVKRAQSREDGAAMVDIARKLLALTAPGKQAEVVAERAVHLFHLGGELPVVRLGASRDVAPGAPEVAFDAFLLDEVQGRAKGLARLGIGGPGVAGAVFLAELRKGLLQPAAEIAGIAPRSAESRIFALQDDDAAPSPQQLDRRAQSRIARPDDGDVVAWSEGNGGGGLGRRSTPPIGLKGYCS